MRNILLCFAVGSEVPSLLWISMSDRWQPKCFPKYQLVFINNILIYFLNYYSEYTYLHFTCGHKYQGYFTGIHTIYTYVHRRHIHKACVVSHLIKAHKSLKLRKIRNLLTKTAFLPPLFQGRNGLQMSKLNHRLKNTLDTTFHWFVRVDSCQITSSVTLWHCT